MKLNDLTGNKYGRLLVIERYRDSDRRTRWLCLCDCGNRKNILTENLKSGNTISCGCFSKENPANLIHGLRWHPLYKIWKNIKDRCYNTKCKRYCAYGGSGIRICDEWLNKPEAFIKWALDRGWERGMEIDKDIIPIKLGIIPFVYSPEMCSVVTRKQNANAKSTSKYIFAFNETKTLAQWAEISPVSYDTIKNRLYMGWEPEKAIITPILKTWKRR